jgi:hypothetical protein
VGIWSVFHDKIAKKYQTIAARTPDFPDAAPFTPLAAVVKWRPEIPGAGVEVVKT